ncbi:putative RNA methyltransferase [Labedella endophytica]|uniref:Methyltransferase domain-containing protein n=1 Tax=Labedella endophytica TaxID=1523160 RepID=A0A3S0XAM9_9MICO|nr:methyltransferase domain-containing protein [Labedella endophytica]RUR00844.1 methyltransferase domain-containing protein [Labedella endophytica]
MDDRTEPLALVADVLACPLCGADVVAVRPSVLCATGHAFDVARQGYASLVVGRAVAGDSAEMIAARDRFLSAGHYDRVSDAVVDAVPSTAGVCVDVGGGTGHHLTRVLDARPGLTGLVIDSSKPALKRAARRHPRAAAVAADAWAALPLRSGSIDVVLSLFAPRNPAETVRVLGTGGLLVVVTPTPRHLAELVAAVGLVRVDERKEERLNRQLADFEAMGSDVLEYRIDLNRADAIDDVLMGPSGHHADADTIAASLASLPDPVAATVSVRVSVFRAKRADS